MNFETFKSLPSKSGIQKQSPLADILEGYKNLAHLPRFFDITKAELLLLNRTQFSYLGIFVSKKVGNQKNQDHFYYISFKICILGGLSFFEIQLFYY